MRSSIRNLGALALAAIVSTGCELGSKEVSQTAGFRGLGMEHVRTTGSLQDSMSAIQARTPPNLPAPPQLEPAPPGTYENVQVLGHLSEVEFTVSMQAITNWVAPEQGCAYCHIQNEDNSFNYASDDIYTKIVARRMLQMTQNINANWASHVREDRQVNCWTCHQGNPVPTNYWFYDGDEAQPLRHYLDRDDLRVQGPVAMAGGAVDNNRTINQTVYAYELMAHMSNSLGVNCTFCHNTGRFASWEDSPPTRVTALRGLRMIRDANMEYMVSLQNVWPENRLGPMGDGPKLSCASCHQGAYRPQYDNPASYGAGWRAITEIGYPHPQAPAEGNGTPADDGVDGGG